MRHLQLIDSLLKIMKPEVNQPVVMALKVLCFVLFLAQVNTLCIQDTKFSLTCYNEDYFQKEYPLVTSLYLIDSTITVFEVFTYFPRLENVYVYGLGVSRVCNRLEKLNYELHGCGFDQAFDVATVTNKAAGPSKSGTTKTIPTTKDTKLNVHVGSATGLSDNYVYGLSFSLAAFIILVLALTCCALKKKKFCVRAQYRDANFDVTLSAAEDQDTDKIEMNARYDELMGEEIVHGEEETVFDRTFLQTPQQSERSAESVVEALRRSTRLKQKQKHSHVE